MYIYYVIMYLIYIWVVGVGVCTYTFVRALGVRLRGRYATLKTCKLLIFLDKVEEQMLKLNIFEMLQLLCAFCSYVGVLQWHTSCLQKKIFNNFTGVARKLCNSVILLHNFCKLLCNSPAFSIFTTVGMSSASSVFPHLKHFCSYLHRGEVVDRILFSDNGELQEV